MYMLICVSGEKIHRTVREMRVPVYVEHTRGHSPLVCSMSAALYTTHTNNPRNIIIIIIIIIIDKTLNIIV